MWALANIWAVPEDCNNEFLYVALFQQVPDTLLKRLRILEIHLIENHPRLALETRFFSMAMKHRLLVTKGFFFGNSKV